MNRALRNISNIGQLAQEKHVTRASLKNADQAGVVTRRGALADHRNVRQLKANQEFLKKGDVRKVTRPVVKKQEKENTYKEETQKQTFTASRFDTVVIHCEEYKENVENYIFYLEQRYGVKPGFLRGLEITPKMRAILVDWLVQLHASCRMCPETFFLAINILDRYLAKGLVTKDTLQLAGVAALSAACKYEEIFPPLLVDYVYISENAISRADIIRMEYKVLSVLDVEIGRPTVIQFLRRISTYFNRKVHIMAKFISENMVVNYNTCHLFPSVIAAVSVWLAVVLDGRSFPTVLYKWARVSKETIYEIAPTTASYLLEMQTCTKLVAVREKYAKTCGQIAKLTEDHIALLTCIANGDLGFAELLP